MMGQVATLLMPDLNVVGAKGLQALQVDRCRERKAEGCARDCGRANHPSDVRVMIDIIRPRPSAGANAPETLAEATLFSRKSSGRNPNRGPRVKEWSPARLYGRRTVQQIGECSTAPGSQGIVAFDPDRRQRLLAQLEVLRRTTFSDQMLRPNSTSILFARRGRSLSATGRSSV